MSDSVLSTLIYNIRKNIVEAYPVVVHNYGSKTQEYLQQLSKVTGATIFDEYRPCRITEVKY